MKGYIPIFLLMVLTACSASEKVAVNTLPATLVADGNCGLPFFNKELPSTRLCASRLIILPVCGSMNCSR